MYGELFDISNPDALVLISWFVGGEAFRSGCCFHWGRGKIFYFRPSDQAFPTYYHPQALQVITNAVHRAVPAGTLAIHYGERPLPTNES
ncbi:hypothetical protein IFO70_39760 [Phormidium tenue FACHB-886]|nr:hypothetical protein [Phormidium tenue FACHB-886]